MKNYGWTVTTETQSSQETFQLSKFSITFVSVYRVTSNRLQYINDFMNTKIVENIQKYLRTQPVKKAWLFGSYSRGEETSESDVDILVQYDRKNYRVGLFTIVSIKQQLQELLGCEVDLVEDGSLLPFAVESANRDKVLIYERNS